jgi:uncharacterized protein YmfQ (DUF2313 family)
MDKKEALRKEVEESLVLSAESKAKLIAQIPSFSDELVDEWAHLLAMKTKDSMGGSDDAVEKRAALQILVTDSFLLSDTDKEKLLHELPTLSDDLVNAWGTLLAIEKKESLEANEEEIKKIDDFSSQSE